MKLPTLRRATLSGETTTVSSTTSTTFMKDKLEGLDISLLLEAQEKHYDTLREYAKYSEEFRHFVTTDFDKVVEETFEEVFSNNVEAFKEKNALWEDIEEYEDELGKTTKDIERFIKEKSLYKIYASPETYFKKLQDHRNIGIALEKRAKEFINTFHTIKEEMTLTT